MALTDEQIKKNVVDELYFDNRVDASKVTVEVDNGAVTLRGEVPTYLAYNAAYNDSLKLLDVISVRNHLVVRYPAGRTIPTDAGLLATVEDKLARNPDIDVMDMDIEVNAGEVILRGTVDAYWKKYYAEDLVASEPGVITITNHLAIVPSGDFVDQDIGDDIVRSLEVRDTVSADDVDVKVDDGKVVLSGTVPSWAARQAAHETAEFTAGVVDVENHITVSKLR